MEIKSLTDNELMQYLANAYVTRCLALGHGKTASNDALVNRYRNELIARGHTIPELGLFPPKSEFLDRLINRGMFNGPGAH